MAAGADPFDLGRFVAAQAAVYDRVVEELRAGHKRSHWIWFIFPQLSGLGSSAMAQIYGIGSPAEARAYLAHDVLGTRLHECARLVNAVRDRSVEEIFGALDALKVRSSMTLFARVADIAEGAEFRALLEHYYGGAEDPVTLDRLARLAGPD